MMELSWGLLDGGNSVAIQVMFFSSQVQFMLRIPNLPRPCLEYLHRTPCSLHPHNGDVNAAYCRTLHIAVVL